MVDWPLGIRAIEGVGVTVLPSGSVTMVEQSRRRDRSVRWWLLGWSGGVLIGIVNGAVREKAYAPRVGEARAHRISCVTAIGAFAAWFAVLQRWHPLRSTRQALAVGGAWLLMTVLFELTFGRLVAHQSWRELLADYDLRRGRWWPVVLAWLGVGPAVTRALSRPSQPQR